MDKTVRTSSAAVIAIIIASLALGAILVFRGNMLDSKNPSASHGASLYDRNCAVCHGTSGKGDGPVASLLDPRPRDFSIGKYRLISNTNGIPSKQDLIHTIRNGMPGTSMPAWRHLSAQDVELLAEHTFAFTTESLKQQLTAKKLKPAVMDSLLKSKTTAGEKVLIPPEPPVTAAELEKGRVLFEANCARCHTSTGVGMRDPAWKTDEGHPISSRNFTSKIFKGGSRSADLFTRISTGMAGTPMASFSGMPPDDMWRLVHYIQSFDLTGQPGGTSDALVRIEARRFAWNFRHAGRDNRLDTADDIVTNGLLHIPASKRVNYELISTDVQHTLWIPSQRVKQSVEHGQVIRGALEVPLIGEYGIGCAAPCGAGREVMSATLIVHSAADYERFLSNKE